MIHSGALGAGLVASRAFGIVVIDGAGARTSGQQRFVSLLVVVTKVGSLHHAFLQQRGPQ
jgi:hypothetical protein